VSQVVLGNSQVAAAFYNAVKSEDFDSVISQMDLEVSENPVLDANPYVWLESFAKKVVLRGQETPMGSTAPVKQTQTKPPESVITTPAGMKTTQSTPPVEFDEENMLTWSSEKYTSWINEQEAKAKAKRQKEQLQFRR